MTKTPNVYHIPTDMLGSIMKEKNRGIEDLPKEYRKVWKHYHVYSFSPKEISEMFGVPLHIVNRIIKRSELLLRLY